MVPRVKLVSVPEPFTTLQARPEVIAFVSLYIDHNLMPSLAAILTRKARPRTIEEALGWLFESLPMASRAKARAIALAAGPLFNGYFETRRISNEEDKVRLLAALMLESYVERFLSQRLKAALRRDVQVIVAGSKIEPTANNLDFGYADGGAQEGAEFYECKTKPSDLFEQPTDAMKPQLQLLLNIHNRLKESGWRVTCAVPTLLSQDSAHFALRRVGGMVLAVGIKWIPDLKYQRPVARPSGWIMSPGL